MAMAMCMTVEDEVESVRPLLRCLLRVMKHENSPAGPFERPRRQDEIQSEARRVHFQSGLMSEIVVAEYAEERSVELRELFENDRFREISGVNDAIDANLIEEAHDSLDIGHSIMGIADDANPHRRMLSRRPTAPGDGYDARSSDGIVNGNRER